MNKQLKVADVTNEYKVVINAGSDLGIQEGQRYLLYALSSEEILDPDTHESLGYLEIVKGTGKVIHVQERMSTIESDSYRTSSKTVSRKNPFMGAFGSTVEEIESDKKHVPFENPEVGDLLKRIN